MTLVQGQVTSSPFARPAARQVQVGSRRYVVSFAGSSLKAQSTDLGNTAPHGFMATVAVIGLLLSGSTFDNLKRPSFYGAIDVDRMAIHRSTRTCRGWANLQSNYVYPLRFADNVGVQPCMRALQIWHPVPLLGEWA